jgi:hypothetical protein
MESVFVAGKPYDCSNWVAALNRGTAVGRYNYADCFTQGVSNAETQEETSI